MSHETSSDFGSTVIVLVLLGTIGYLGLRVISPVIRISDIGAGDPLSSGQNSLIAAVSQIPTIYLAAGFFGVVLSGLWLFAYISGDR
ncbi:hypothetical protein [Halorientalis sp. IM1011]|uniref:hypothetical protein n=1 Tax=Halorientalis sp. IM1011 TaxID=1932360 RepID=UPI001560011F|nr:hypothetical protein [Halorientalis sp. IM1011]